MATDIDDDEIVSQVALKLAHTFPDVPSAEVQRAVNIEFATFADAPVRSYLAVLTERKAKSRLQSLRAA